MITRDDLREWEAGAAPLPEWEQTKTLARLVRLAIAADEMLHSPRTAQQAALRDALREEGLRSEPVSVADELGKDGMR